MKLFTEKARMRESRLTLPAPQHLGEISTAAFLAATSISRLPNSGNPGECYWFAYSLILLYGVRVLEVLEPHHKFGASQTCTVPPREPLPARNQYLGSNCRITIGGTISSPIPLRQPENCCLNIYQTRLNMSASIQLLIAVEDVITQFYSP